MGGVLLYRDGAPYYHFNIAERETAMTVMAAYVTVLHEAPNPHILSGRQTVKS
jgi:hypothetical protein